MEKKKNSKNAQAKKAVKVTPSKPVNKTVQTKKANAKPAAVKHVPAKTVRTKKVSVKEDVRTVSYVTEEKAFKIGKYSIKKTHALVAATIAVLVLLVVLF